ncbi:hypothetical protein C8F01DRAFT_1373949 [Mycena amicta]|nr:hypothetical protein C8F01DRAFT_1373949 [Mycena amicta]
MKIELTAVDVVNNDELKCWTVTGDGRGGVMDGDGDGRCLKWPKGPNGDPQLAGKGYGCTIGVDPNPTLGALLIGTLCGAILYGVTTMQAYIYFTRFPDDHWMIKSTICFIWMAESAHVGAVSHTLYTLIVLDYGHPERLLERPPRSIIGYIFLTVSIAVCVQIFFAYRIYILSKSRIIPFITYTLSFVRFVLGTSLFAVGLSVKSVTEFGTKWQWLGITMWSLSAAEDVTITATLVYLLWRQKGGVKTTNAFLDKIIKWSIETGLLTCSFSLITVILFHKMPDNFIWIAFSTLEARMFSNSLFARYSLSPLERAIELTSTPSLNSRSVLRELRNRPRTNNSTGLVSFSASTWAKPTGTSEAPGISVEVHTSTRHDSDMSVRKPTAF